MTAEEATAGSAWQQLPKQARDVLVTVTKTALPRLAKARRPKDLKALARDPALIEALGRDLAPVLETAIRYALPVRGRLPTHVSATVTGAAGPLAANVAEGLLLAGPQAAAIGAPTAVTIQFSAAVLETYVEFSTIVQKLRGAGIDDRDDVMLAIMRTLVPDATSATKTVVTRGLQRLAQRMVLRAARGWLPLAGPILGSVSSNFDMHRAHRAAEGVIRERRRGAEQRRRRVL